MEDRQPFGVNASETVFVGIGDANDPLPHIEKKTKYWVYAAPCPRCSSPARWIEQGPFEVRLRCSKCNTEEGIGLSLATWQNLSYVYWCRSPVFKSDLVPLPKTVVTEIEKIISDSGGVEKMPSPYLAVVIVGGVCEKTLVCASKNCPYKVGPKSVKGGKTNIISITSKNRK